MSSRDPKGPEDEWPKHTNKDLNHVLEEARATGWSYKRGTSHGTARIYCPAEECRVRIDSTPKNPTGRAKRALREVRNCIHGNDPAPVLVDAARKMDKSERLIEGVEGFITYRERVDYLDAPGLTEEEVDVAIEAAAQLEAEVSKLLGGVSKDDARDGYGEAEGLLSAVRSQVLPFIKRPSVTAEVAAATSRHGHIKERLYSAQADLQRVLKSP